MARWLFAQRQVMGSPVLVERRLIEDLRPLLQAATVQPITDPGGDGSFVIDLPGQFLSVDMRKRVRVNVGAFTKTSTLLSIPVRWHAEPGSAVFPRFDGAIEYESWSSASGQLMLVGQYTGPMEPLGSLAGAVATHAVADRTAAVLLRHLVEQLDAVVRSGATYGTVTDRGMHVGDVMTADPILFDDDVPLRTAALVLLRGRISGAPVVDRSGALVGLLSERDLLDKEAGRSGGWGRSASAGQRRLHARTAGQACTRPALVTAPDSTLREAAEEMARHGVSRLVVLDGARIAGVISRHDVLRALIRTDAELEAAANEQLATLDTYGLAVTVEGGVVTLKGRAGAHSGALSWLEAVQRVDGVIDIEDQLTWEFDDLVPPVVF